MLDHLRQQAIDALAQASKVALTTGGIAGLQTSVLPCESIGLNLYVLALQTADHLANIEGNSECVALTDNWQLRGIACLVSMSDFPTLALTRAPDVRWSALIEIHPTRLQIVRQAGTGYSATIDVDQSIRKETEMKTQQGTRDVNKLLLKTIAVAMAIGVVVLNILHAATPETQSMLLGLGLFGLATASLSKEG